MSHGKNRTRRAPPPHRLIVMSLMVLAVQVLGIAPSEAREQHEPISVHGHWVIDVRNPDGTLARHLDFENGFCTGAAIGGAGNGGGGDAALSNLLVGAATPSGWEIVLADSTIPSNPGPACPYNATAFSQILVLSQNNSGISAGSSSSGTCGVYYETCQFATLNPPTLSSTQQSFTLSGQFTVPANTPSTKITTVATVLVYCGNNNVSPSACQGAIPPAQNSTSVQITGAYLTGTSPMPAAVTIVPNQTVSVNVTISFH